MKALVLGGFAHMDTDTKQQYWAEVGTNSGTVGQKKKMHLELTAQRCLRTSAFDFVKF